ncbi:hypothetical protein BB561_004078 [Smittium simulii]|uniref:Zinc-ribbon 15 domain-containing protein n=1 Tax=Smittium simulii TaxID=133385 RepID=A0A2T9YI76_9FUNG|nr:hypothetical protein BB561_004078 [Smittium simulii]
MFFLIAGTDTQIKHTSQPMYMCPRCNNFSVRSAIYKKKVSFFYVPLIPIKNKNVYHCQICNWIGDVTVVPPQVAQQQFEQRDVSRQNYMKS